MADTFRDRIIQIVQGEGTNIKDPSNDWDMLELILNEFKQRQTQKMVELEGENEELSSLKENLERLRELIGNAGLQLTSAEEAAGDVEGYADNIQDCATRATGSISDLGETIAELESLIP